MIFSGLELLGEIPFTRRDHPLDRARARRPADVEVARHRHRPARADRAARHGRDPLRPDEELAHAGRALLVLGDRGGREALEQALERSAADRHRVRRRRAGRAARRRSRSGGSSRGSRRRSGASSGCSASSTSPTSTDELYHLTFDDFCDWYLEAVKARLYDGDADARATATAALERLLKLLHPVMPHVTEEIWSNLPARTTRLIVAPWPEAGDEARRAMRSSACRSGAGVPPLRRRAAARGRRAADLRRPS